MNGTRKGMGWGARLILALAFIMVGAAAAVWSLAHYPRAATTLGVAPATQGTVAPGQNLARVPGPPPSAANPAPAAENQRIAALEQRLSQVEN